jgi:hypothetical protein
MKSFALLVNKLALFVYLAGVRLELIEVCSESLEIRLVRIHVESLPPKLLEFFHQLHVRGLQLLLCRLERRRIWPR